MFRGQWREREKKIFTWIDILGIRFNEYLDTVRTFCHDIILACGDRVISIYLDQYHGCWCPGSFRRQDISNHDIDYVE